MLYIYIYKYVQYMYSVIIWLCIYSTNMLGNHKAWPRYVPGKGFNYLCVTAS